MSYRDTARFEAHEINSWLNPGDNYDITYQSEREIEEARESERRSKEYWEEYEERNKIYRENLLEKYWINMCIGNIVSFNEWKYEIQSLWEKLTHNYCMLRVLSDDNNAIKEKYNRYNILREAVLDINFLQECLEEQKNIEKIYDYDFEVYLNKISQSWINAIDCNFNLWIKEMKELNNKVEENVSLLRERQIKDEKEIDKKIKEIEERIKEEKEEKRIKEEKERKEIEKRRKEERDRKYHDYINSNEYKKEMYIKCKKNKSNCSTNMFYFILNNVLFIIIVGTFFLILFGLTLYGLIYVLYGVFIGIKEGHIFSPILFMIFYGGVPATILYFMLYGLKIYINKNKDEWKIYKEKYTEYSLELIKYKGVLCN